MKIQKILIYTLISMIIYSYVFGQEEDKKFGIVIHGGAGVILKENMDANKENLYREALEQALEKGYTILQNGGSSLEAVRQAIIIMEDNPLFNAGRGAVFNHNGAHTMDASIMEGKNLNAGAVAGISGIKNPILAASLVMTNSEHVMLSGKEAVDFAIHNGLEQKDEEYFFNEQRWKSLQKALQKEKSEKGKSYFIESEEYKFGTVGAVALDKAGNLAAATSTGGMTNKKFGRIGDSPIIGAGTYANNATCAISCTGHGEFFIRYTVAHDVSALMEYLKLSLNDAAEMVINSKLKTVGGEGGLIGIDKDGNITLTFNTPGMYRAYKTSTGEFGINIFTGN
jgi:beta-aspartyl-peptidase (threonine type)